MKKGSSTGPAATRAPGRGSRVEEAQIRVKVQTRSSRPGIGPKSGEEWVRRVAAAPVENAANGAVLGLLASSLGIAASRIRLTSGARSTHKRFQVEGMSPEEVERLLGEAWQ